MNLQKVLPPVWLLLSVISMIGLQTNLELKSKLFSQIEILGKEKSLLPFSNTSIDETIKVKNIWQSIYNPHPSAPQMKCV